MRRVTTGQTCRQRNPQKQIGHRISRLCLPDANAGLMLRQRRRRWRSIQPALVQHLVFVGFMPLDTWLGVGLTRSLVFAMLALFFCWDLLNDSRRLPGTPVITLTSPVPDSSCKHQTLIQCRFIVGPNIKRTSGVCRATHMSGIPSFSEQFTL